MEGKAASLHAKKSNDRNNNVEATGALCVLQLGDSLTQGVGDYPSYRELLAPMLVDWWEGDTMMRGVSSSATSARMGFGEGGGEAASRGEGDSGIHYMGSQTRRCTPKKPSAPYTRGGGGEAGGQVLPAQPHEGHCSWGSSAIRKSLEQLLLGTTTSGMGKVDALPSLPSVCRRSAVFHQQSSSTSSSSSETATSLPPPLSVSFAMMGHNDAFQVARLCKLKEDQSGSIAAVRRANSMAMERLMRMSSLSSQTSMISDVGFTAGAFFTQFANASAKDDAFGSSSSLSSSTSASAPITRQQQQCVMRHLAGAEAFADNVRYVMERLVAMRIPSEARGDVGSSSHAILLWGLNPPVGFPSVDVAIRAILVEEAFAVFRKVTANAAEGAALGNKRQSRAPPPSPSDSASLPSFFPIRFVPFTGFTPGAHTFDSTHPNAEGALLMAKAWLKGLREARQPALQAIMMMAPPAAVEESDDRRRRSNNNNGGDDSADEGGGGSKTINKGGTDSNRRRFAFNSGGKNFRPRVIDADEALPFDGASHDGIMRGGAVASSDAASNSVVLVIVVVFTVALLVLWSRLKKMLGAGRSDNNSYRRS